MTHFASPRERRLWSWALAVLIAIYATLGLAGTFAGYLAAEGVLEAAFALSFLVVVIAIAGHAVTRESPARGLWITAAIVAVYAMVFVRLGVVERTHIFEYGVLAVLIHEALLERRRSGGSVRVPAVWAVVATALLGWVDEGIQGFLPNRVYDLRDVGVNALAALMAISASLALAWARGTRAIRRWWQ